MKIFYSLTAVALAAAACTSAFATSGGGHRSGPSSGGTHIGNGSGNFSPSATGTATSTAKTGPVTAHGGGGGSVSHSGNSTNVNNLSSTGGTATAGSIGSVSGNGNTVKLMSPEAHVNSKNINTAKGGSAKQNQTQKQAQRQSQSQTNDQRNNQVVTINSGDNQYTVEAARLEKEAQIEAARIMDDVTIRNVPSVSGPSLTSSNDTCMGSSSGSVNATGIGVGFGTTWTDENCRMLKNSRELWNMGMKAAALALMCTDPKNREALELTGYKCPATSSTSSKKPERSPAAPGFSNHYHHEHFSQY